VCRDPWPSSMRVFEKKNVCINKLIVIFTLWLGPKRLILTLCKKRINTEYLLNDGGQAATICERYLQI